MLARLFAQPANVLVLDEPTNDLDIETLELLESLLQEYAGTIFVISHDRAFLDNVVTQVVAFEGDGVLREYVGGYSDWAAYQANKAMQQQDTTAPRNDESGSRNRASSAPHTRDAGSTRAVALPSAGNARHAPGCRSTRNASARRCRSVSKRWKQMLVKCAVACPIRRCIAKEPPTK